MICKFKVTYTFFGKHEKEFNNLKNAAKFALSVYSKKFYQNNSLYLSEVIYASQDNENKHFSLQEFPRWAIWFHSIEDLEILAEQSEKEGSTFTYNGNSITFKEYKKLINQKDKM